MKKNDVKIGETYFAKVSDKIARVRIDGENRHGGWDATNLETGKKVRIKSAQRLRSEVRGDQIEEKPKAGKGKKAEATARATNDATSDETVPVKKRRKAEGPKRVSALDAAAIVLEKAGKPMQCNEMIQAMAEQGLWSSPAGKTPAATLYSAILREIGNKGAESRFAKSDRGQFAFNK